MPKRFKIYSAARAEDGRYRFSNDEQIYIKEFPDQSSMSQYWQEVVLPASCTRIGMRYELSMTEFAGADWDFIGDPRYADQPVLNDKQIASVAKAKANSRNIASQNSRQLGRRYL